MSVDWLTNRTNSITGFTAYGQVRYGRHFDVYLAEKDVSDWLVELHVMGKRSDLPLGGSSYIIPQWPIPVRIPAHQTTNGFSTKTDLNGRT